MEMNPTLIAIIIGLICGIIGYFIGKGSQKPQVNEVHNYKSELDACNQKNNQLKADVDALSNQLNKVNSSSEKSNFVSEPIDKPSTADVLFDANTAKAVFGKKIKQDDLKIVEGIGPKIEELFKTSGILSWKALGETSVDRCNKILDKAGERYRIHNPGTWPKQAKLAYQGKWQKLKDLQYKLHKGKEK